MAPKTAVVTGGGAGIGEAISRRLARDGLAVGVLDINIAAASIVAQEINSSGGKALAVQADVASRSQIERAILEIRRAFGPVTVLINNAGIESFKSFDEITDDCWDNLMAVNLKGTFIATQVVLPDMKDAGWGRVVNISSSSAQSGAERMAHYSASKGGVIALTKTLAREFGPMGITVNTIPPGLIDTPMTERAHAGGNLRAPLSELASLAPVRRRGRPDDIAAACSYLVSDDAGYVTGQIIGVNGGRYI